MKNILVTCAFPYANGPIHIGHILEHIQADIWVRYQKLLGNNVYFICADDSHGTSIIIKSNELNLSPEIMISNILNEHKIQFKKFNILHDFYYTTHNKINYFYCLLLLNNLKIKNLLYNKNVYQFYDLNKNIFLPDRFLKGQCPRCKKYNQYNDVCEYCNQIYSSYNLINPISLLSNTIPVLKKTNHLFINIKKYKKILFNWILISNFQNEIKNQLLFWLDNNLVNWNISRDYPYFGFKIPNIYILNKWFYVWFDAILGYISVFKKYCYLNDYSKFYDFWKIDSDYEIYHFIGKDVLYFHGLLWPIMLDVLNFRKPTNIIVHGHIKINNLKMSKSKNNFISVNKWLNYFDSDSLRYYFASKLSYKINDINLCMNDFIKTINCNFVNSFINIPSRIYPFINKYYNNYLSNKLLNYNFYNFFISKYDLINNYFLNFNYYKVILEVNKLINLINKYINDYKPWLICKYIKKKKELHRFCTTIINVFSIISIYLSPIIPIIFNKIQKFLNIKLYWKKIKIPILNHKINKYKKLYKCIDKSFLNKFYNG